MLPATMSSHRRALTLCSSRHKTPSAWGRSAAQPRAAGDSSFSRKASQPSRSYEGAVPLRMPTLATSRRSIVSTILRSTAAASAPRPGAGRRKCSRRWGSRRSCWCGDARPYCNGPRSDQCSRCAPGARYRAKSLRGGGGGGEGGPPWGLGRQAAGTCPRRSAERAARRRGPERSRRLSCCARASASWPMRCCRRR